MHCDIDKNHTVFCGCIVHKCYYEVKTNWQLLQASLAVDFQSSLQEYCSQQALLYRFCQILIVIGFFLHSSHLCDNEDCDSLLYQA